MLSIKNTDAARVLDNRKIYLFQVVWQSPTFYRLSRNIVLSPRRFSKNSACSYTAGPQRGWLRRRTIARKHGPGKIRVFRRRSSQLSRLCTAGIVVDCIQVIIAFKVKAKHAGAQCLLVILQWPLFRPHLDGHSLFWVEAFLARDCQPRALYARVAIAQSTPVRTSP